MNKELKNIVSRSYEYKEAATGGFQVLNFVHPAIRDHKMLADSARNELIGGILAAFSGLLVIVIGATKKKPHAPPRN